MIMKKSLGGLALLAMGTLMACSNSGNRDGRCPGKSDGQIYYLQVLNFIEYRISGYVDERKVGEVPIYNEADHAPGFVDFGHFSQCTESEIDFGGQAELEFEQVVWTQTAVDLYQNGCAIEMHLVTSNPDDSFYGDWTTHGKLLPAAYRDVENRPFCSPGWKFVMQIDGDLAIGTPTPTDIGPFIID